MKTKRSNQGITLIALVITIIVLLILAGVSIATLTGENGILTQAVGAKDSNIIANEKEIIQLAATDSKLNNAEKILEYEGFQGAINNYVGNGKAEVSEAGENFIVYFVETKHFYEVNKDGIVEKNDDIEIASDPYPGDITKDKEGNLITGEADDPYEINCVEDLVNFSNRVNSGENFEGKHIILNQSLNMAFDLSYAEPDNQEMFGDYNGDGITEGIKDELINQSGSGFNPISEFSGTFLGNYKKIENLYINSKGGMEGFIEINKGNIEKLKVSGKLNYQVESLTSRFTCIGGLVGLNEGNVADSTNEINLEITIESGQNTLYAAGITGATDGGNIQNCYNKGKISIKSEAANVDIRVAGIVGRLDSASIVRNSNNENEIYVEGKEYILASGIACDLYNGVTVEQCSNKGKIEATAPGRVWLGGIIASSSGNSIISNSYNKGNLYATANSPRVGGIFGAISSNETISNSYNTGLITVESNGTGGLIGGIGGDFGNNSKIQNSYNAGNVQIAEEGASVGIILGYGMAGVIENTYALSQEGISLIGYNGTITLDKVEAKTSEEMKKDTFVDLLNDGKENYKDDTNNQNQGYPILSWQ